MDPPKTRRELKKDPKTKAQGKTVYTAKHIRQREALAGKKKQTQSLCVQSSGCV